MEQDGKKKLYETANEFAPYLELVLEKTNTNQVHFVGNGNSIGSGWTAINNDVRPFVLKLQPFLEEACLKRNIPITFSAFTMAGDNSNQRIYDFLLANPTLEDVHNYFEHIFDDWKERYQGTLFENYVDKNEALSCYPKSNQHFRDYYAQDAFTFTSFYGCTGLILTNVLGYLFSKDVKEQMTKVDMLYLHRIIAYIKSLSQNGFISIGNFPYLNCFFLKTVNHFIRNLNERIKKVVGDYKGVSYFESASTNLFYFYKRKIIMDLHPNLKLQYEMLLNYLKFLMQEIPLLLVEQEEEKNPAQLVKKYKSYDSDGHLVERIYRRYE